MIVNFAGVAGGRSFSESMHVKQTYATWIAASYGYGLNRYQDPEHEAKKVIGSHKEHSF